MLRFKGFLTEVELIPYMSKRGNRIWTSARVRTVVKHPIWGDSDGPPVNFANHKTPPEKINSPHGDTLSYKSTVRSTGHHVYHDHKYDQYMAINPHTSRIDMQVDGTSKTHKNGNKTFHIGTLAGRQGSPLKAHKFYSHLIKHHGLILHATTHSPGGMHVWQQLGKEKGINVHGWKRGKPVNVKPNKSEPEETHEPNRSNFFRKDKVIQNRNTPEEDEVKNIHLIAHKR